MLEKINQIHDIWFEFGDSNEEKLKYRPLAHWEASNTNIDDKLSLFEDIYYLAVNQKLRFWWEQPRSCLAFIILTNELPLRMYRDSPLSFENAEIAIDAAEHGRAHKLDKDLSLIQRYFFYSPYYQAEDLHHQRLSLALLGQLMKSAKEQENPWQSYFELQYSQQVDRYDVILNFGRFPERNEILERESTQEELLFLGLPGNQC